MSKGITMHPVVSSNVAGLGHHHGDVLRVQYKNGGVYDFEGVTEERFNEVMQLESIGRAINQLGIKGRKVVEDSP